MNKYIYLRAYLYFDLTINGEENRDSHLLEFKDFGVIEAANEDEAYRKAEEKWPMTEKEEFTFSNDFVVLIP